MSDEKGATPPGWYDDGRGAMRYWDGRQWTQHTAPQPSGQPVPAPHAGASSGRGRGTWIAAAVVLILVLAGGGFAVWKFTSGGSDRPDGPRGVAEEYLDLMYDGIAEGETDGKRLCEISSGGARTEILEGETIDDPADYEDVDCDEFAEAVETALYGLAESFDGECRTAAEALTWDIETTGEPDGSKATIEADMRFDGFSEFAEACWGEEESDTGTIELFLSKSGDDWVVDRVDW